MKVIIIIHIVHVWMSVIGLLLSTNQGFIERTEVHCYSPPDKTLSCLHGKEMRVINARYWFYSCNQTTIPLCYPYGSGSHNIIQTQPDCQEDVYQHNKTRYQQYLEKCSGKNSCHIKIHLTETNSTCQSYRYSFLVAITLQCIKSENVMNFCTGLTTKHITYGLIETTGYPKRHNGSSCWCLLNAPSNLTELRIIQANNTRVEFHSSYHGLNIDKIESLNGSYVINKTVTNQTLQSVHIFIGASATQQLSIYFKLQHKSMVHFQCWNGTVPPFTTTTTTTTTKATTPTAIGTISSNIVSTASTNGVTTTTTITTTSTTSSITLNSTNNNVVTTNTTIPVTITTSQEEPRQSSAISETPSFLIKDDMKHPEDNNLAPILGGGIGGVTVLVIIAFIAIMVVKSHRKNSEASKQPSDQVHGDSNYHDIPDLLVNSGTTIRLQITNGVQNSNFDESEAYEELPDRSEYTSTSSSLSHDRHYTSLKQDKKPSQNQKSLTHSKTCSNKDSCEMPDYAKVNKKKKEPTYFELELEDTPTNKPVYAKVNKQKTEPNYFELEPQVDTITSNDNQHDYFELESSDSQKRISPIDNKAEVNYTYFELEANENEQNKSDFQNSDLTYSEIESGSADGAVNLKPDNNDYAYTYAHFNRDPTIKKESQEHDDDKVEFIDNDIYNTDKVEFIDNDVYNTS